MSTETTVVLVTGCTRGGIGYSICKSFARREGFRVYATARKVENMNGLEDCSKLALDITNGEAILNVVKTIIDKEGHIDILFNNAGIPAVGALLDVELDYARICMETNVFGPLSLARAVAPLMAKRGHGKIVNVGSVAAYGQMPWASVYALTKSALHNMSDVLRLELKPFGINVTVVAPGAITSNIGKASVQTIVLPSDSLYQSIAHIITRRATMSQGSHSTPTDTFAETVVNKILQSNPPGYVTTGTSSFKFLLMYYLPTFIRDYLYEKQFGIDQVKPVKIE
ncbi:oxidoreductase [Chlamydoabsidia padenii]|nr:oxidoreductase [Chlamydoabsidia padenii]